MITEQDVAPILAKYQVTFETYGSSYTNSAKLVPPREPGVVVNPFYIDKVEVSPVRTEYRVCIGGRDAQTAEHKDPLVAFERAVEIAHGQCSRALSKLEAQAASLRVDIAAIEYLVANTK